MDISSLQTLVTDWLKDQPSLPKGITVTLQLQLDSLPKIVANQHTQEQMLDLLEITKKRYGPHTLTKIKKYFDSLNISLTDMTVEDFIKRFPTQDSFRSKNVIGKNCVQAVFSTLLLKGYKWE